MREGVGRGCGWGSEVGSEVEGACGERWAAEPILGASGRVLGLLTPKHLQPVPLPAGGRGCFTFLVSITWLGEDQALGFD